MMFCDFLDKYRDHASRLTYGQKEQQSGVSGEDCLLDSVVSLIFPYCRGGNEIDERKTVDRGCLYMFEKSSLS